MNKPLLCDRGVIIDFIIHRLEINQDILDTATYLVKKYSLSVTIYQVNKYI
ncbi:MAG: hypothetical protein KAH84_03430 [Thiomargarita sp.]|nr:hypothetical protein [Thiomargarita sp.]